MTKILMDVRIKEHFGLITNDTSTSQLSFLVSPPKNRETIEKYNINCLNHHWQSGQACQNGESQEISSYEELCGCTIGPHRVRKTPPTAKIFRLRSPEELKTAVAPANCFYRQTPAAAIYMPHGTISLEDALKRGARGKSYSQPLYMGNAEIFRRFSAIKRRENRNPPPPLT